MATARDTREEGDGIIALVKETADGLGQLIADHVKLARVELVSDARGYARELTLLVVAGLVLFLGYAAGWVAIALAAARAVGGPAAFAGVAVLHLIAGAIGIALAIRRMRRVRLMHDTAQEVSRSVNALGRSLPARSS